MTQPKKLIEVAMPIKEISAESVRDKNIKTGLPAVHQWWARRPLPVCRSVIFASLVPDPLDVNCPQAFRDAVEILLGSSKSPLQDIEISSDVYEPYNDIPYTSAIDQMEDSLRNRLLMFIGKFSNEFCKNEKAGIKTNPKDQLANDSLIKWDNKNNEFIINKARKLIWVAYNSKPDTNNLSAKELLADFEVHHNAIKKAEEELYSQLDRHIISKNIEQLIIILNQTTEAFQNKMPKVFDPFAGGGAIPSEAARLGCRSFGNDINPVAHIIQKSCLEFPQKFGKPINYSKTEFINLYGEIVFNETTNDNKVYENGVAVAVNIANRLAFDVDFYLRTLLKRTEEEVSFLYPKNEKGEKPIAYYWARVATCSNPSCKAEVPLFRQFYMCKKKDKSVYLNPIIIGNKIDFEIKDGNYTFEGWMERANLKCPCCGSITDVKKIKEQFFKKQTKERLIAVIDDTVNGKKYRLPSQIEKDIINLVPESEIPSELMPLNDSQNVKIPLWGFHRWGDMFSARQLFTLQTIIVNLKKIKNEIDADNDEYKKAIVTYLGLFVDKIVTFVTSFGRWDSNTELLKSPFSKQAIPMIFDFPETTIFNKSTGGAYTQIRYITDFIKEEGKNSFNTICNNASSGDKEQFSEKFITAVITDPPYYDAIAYADLSDFFYVWMKRTLADIYPLNFATPQTPKTEECTAIKHHHNNSRVDANRHFENKLLQIFDAIEHQTSDIVSIMFAHQSTEAWTTLCNSILGARMNITGSWAMDTESTSRSLSLNSAVLASSVTVACLPSQRNGYGEYKEVRKAIELKVEKEVDELYSLGFRGADLLTACFGQAVSEFGKYERVEKADGTEVTVADLLEMARESAFNALLKGFDGDDFTKFYIGWLQLYSFTESDFDDAAKFSRVGLSINVQELFTEHILIKHNGNKQTLGTFEERIKNNKTLGEKPNSFLIDQVHRGMALFKGNNRGALLQYIAKIAAQPESSFWRVLTSICELLPNGCEDHKQAIGLLANKDSLIRESKTVQPVTYEQGNLFE